MNDDKKTGTLDELFYPMAIKMARRGATRGMIVQKLRKEKLDDQTAGRVADHAMRKLATRKRILGVGIILAGLALMGTAWFISDLVPIKTSIATGMFGLIVLGLGISQVTHRATLPKETPGSRQRIR